MVQIIANLTPPLYKRIKELIDSGDYDSVAQFVEVACENQVELSKDSTGSLTAPKQTQIAQATPSGKNSTPKIHHRKAKKKQVSSHSRRKVERENGAPDEAVKEALVLFRSNIGSIPDPMPAVTEYTSQWPWGQTNRYLPLKMAVRAIANFSDEKWPELKTVSDRLGLSAGAIGSTLVQADAEHVRKREAALATALPRYSEEKSQLRFVNNFLGTITPTGIFYPGGCFFFGFTALNQDNRVGLTEAGLEFCKLHNPVVDDAPDLANSTLSESEKSWLRTHARGLPGESRAFQVLTDALGQDVLSPTEFASRVSSITGEDKDGGAFKIRLSGAISRMVELGLIKRNWEGTRAKYVVT